jgi:hypothetical protein
MHVIRPHVVRVTRLSSARAVVFRHMDAPAAKNSFKLLLLLLVTISSMLSAGCATVTGTPMQPVSIQAVDAFDRPIDGMRCRIANSAADYFGTTPMYDLQVRRSSSDLEVECRRGALLARATAVSRGTHLLSAMMPGGTAAMIIDHVTGYRYSYPSRLKLRVGEHLVFDPDVAVPSRTRIDAQIAALR